MGFKFNKYRIKHPLLQSIIILFCINLISVSIARKSLEINLTNTALICKSIPVFPLQTNPPNAYEKFNLQIDGERKTSSFPILTKWTFVSKINPNRLKGDITEKCIVAQDNVKPVEYLDDKVTIEGIIPYIVFLSISNETEFTSHLAYVRNINGEKSVEWEYFHSLVITVSFAGIFTSNNNEYLIAYTKYLESKKVSEPEQNENFGALRQTRSDEPWDEPESPVKADAELPEPSESPLDKPEDPPEKPKSSPVKPAVTPVNKPANPPGKPAGSPPKKSVNSSSKSNSPKTKNSAKPIKKKRPLPFSQRYFQSFRLIRSENLSQEKSTFPKISPDFATAENNISINEKFFKSIDRDYSENKHNQGQEELWTIVFKKCPRESELKTENNVTEHDIRKSPDEVVNYFLTILKATCNSQIKNETLKLFKSGIVQQGSGFRIEFKTDPIRILKSKMLTSTEFEDILSSLYLVSFSNAYIDTTLKSTSPGKNRTPSGQEISATAQIATSFVIKILNHMGSSRFKPHFVKIAQGLINSLFTIYSKLIEQRMQFENCNECYKLKEINLQDQLQFLALADFVISRLTEIISFVETNENVEIKFNEHFKTFYDRIIDFVLIKKII